MRRLEFEASWRHDQYSDVAGTSNAKLAFNWSPIESFTIRGGWGQSFRAPNFGEFSPISNVTWDGWNLGQVYTQNDAPLNVLCAGGAPQPGSGAEKMFNAGFGCNSTPGGLSIGPGGYPPVAVGMRDFTNTEHRVLDPEKAVNWSIGFDYTPTGNFLTGLNIQATYYIVKINGILRGFNNPTNGTFNNSALGFSFVTPEDLIDPVTNAQLCAGQNATPWLCAPFQDIVQRSLNQTANEVPPDAQTLIYWLNDGGTMNLGYQTTEGIDFQWSYDWEWEGIGAFNTGMIGTYYISQPGQVVFGGPVDDFYHTNLAPVNGVQQLGVEFASALQVPGPPRLERRHLERDRFHGLRAALLPHDGRAPEREQRLHHARRHGGRVTGLQQPMLPLGLQQPPTELLHVRSVAGIQHRRPARERVLAEHQRPARGAEHHGQDFAL